MILVAVEVLSVGSKPPVAVGVCIFKGKRHDFNAAAPFSTKTSPCEGEREVWLSRRDWSSRSGRLGPFLQNSYPRASLKLQ